MVFSVNAVEGGSNNFAAFQAKAKALNGTSASTPGAGSSLSVSAFGLLGAFVSAIVML